MRIAWFTPFNADSAIGHYSEAITRELAATDRVVVYASDVGPKTPPRPTALPVIPIGDAPSDALLRQLDGFDAVVYNMGNYPIYHKRICEVLIRRPGVVILHDLVYRDFFLAYVLQEKRDPQGLARLMAYSEGREAVDANRAFLEGRPADDPHDASPLRYPMFRALLHRCLGVIVHSEYSRGRVAESVSAPVARLDFPPQGPCARYGRQAAPARGRGGKVRMLTFGHLHKNKCVHAVIDAIGRSDLLRKGVEYTVVGEGCPVYREELRRRVQELGLSGVVRLTGWLSDDRLWSQLKRADVVVNLRNPHLGESSATLLNALFAGAAVVVWNHGWYAEFPDDVVCKISSEGELPGALERLCRDAGLRSRLGAEARRHAAARFSTAAYCRGFRAFLDVVLACKPILSLADNLSQMLLEIDSHATDGLVERLASEIAGLAAGVAA